MSNMIHVILLGIIQGITEFLPVSTNAHLLLAEKWLGARSELFNVGTQAGAMLALTLVYRRRIWQLLTTWHRDAVVRSYLFKLIAAFLTTSVLGLIATHYGLKHMPQTARPIALALLLGGVLIMLVEHMVAGRPDQIEVTWKVALMVGVAQVVAALFPGTSRSGSTILVAMWLGTRNRSAATDFSFLLGIPTLYAATAYELFTVWRHGGAANEDWGALGLASMVSLLVAWFVVRWLLDYIRHHRFTVFAVYRIVLGVLLLWLMPGHI